jgi:hypothetical protein
MWRQISIAAWNEMHVRMENLLTGDQADVGTELKPCTASSSA